MIRALLLISLFACTAIAADDASRDAPSSQQDRKATRAARKAAKQERDAETAPKKIPSDMKVVDDIVFKQVGDKKLELMLFLPLEKKYEKTPLVVYIHGGGWGGGDRYRVLKNTYLNVIRGLNEAGFTCASIEYRLTSSGNSTVADAEADCRDAIHYLVQHASEYNLDVDRIGTFGTSAGGHLTLVTALGNDKDYPCDPALAAYPAKIRCVAAYFPLVSLVDDRVKKDSNFENPDRLIPIIGGTLDEKHDVAVNLSPLSMVKADSPPIFLAHGDKDTALSYLNSTILRDEAEAKGVPVECIISKGAAHGFSGKDIDPDTDEINRRTVAFFLKYLAKS